MPTFDDGRSPGVRVGDGSPTEYRLADRAAAFVRKLGYEAGDELPAELYRALCRVGDAYPAEGESAADADEASGGSLTADERERLDVYLDAHPATEEVADATVTERGLPRGVADRLAIWVDAPDLDADETERRLDELAAMPGVVPSTTQFSAFEPRVRRVEPSDDGLRYSIDTAEGVLLVVDDRRFASQAGADFEIRAGGSEGLDHVVRVRDGLLRRWRPYRPAGADERPTGEIDERYLDEETYHRYLVRRSEYVQAVLDFFERLPGYALAPAE